jgi:hypothetical protein
MHNMIKINKTKVLSGQAKFQQWKFLEEFLFLFYRLQHQKQQKLDYILPEYL